MPDINTELENSLSKKLDYIRKEYSIRMISMQFYSAFLSKYSFVVESIGEKVITDFIVGHVQLLALQDDEKGIFPDGEFQDYFLSYVSSYVYDYEIINFEAIADLIYRRFNEYQILYINEGKDPVESWNECLRKEWETPSYLKEAVGPSYKELSPRVYRDAIKIIKKNIEYFQLYSFMEEDVLIEALSEVFNTKNLKFTSLFQTEIPQVFISYDKNRYKLSIPSLVLAGVGLFIEWQSNHVIVT